MLIFNTRWLHINRSIKQPKYLIKTITSALMCIGILATTPSSYANTSNTNAPSNLQRLGKIAVIVNNQAISNIDIAQRIQILKEQFNETDKNPINESELETAVTERLIYERLMLQTAQAQNLMPSESVVEQAINNNATQSGLSKNDFLDRVVASGMSINQYTEEIKRDIAINAAREKNVAQRIQISEADIDRFLDSPESGITVEYTPLILFIPKPEGVNPESAEFIALKRKADTLHKETVDVKKAADFLKLQPTLSKENPHIVEPGARTLDKLPNLFAQALKTMAVGDTSDVLESSAGFFIVRLQNKETKLPKVSQTLVRHILLSVPNLKAETTAREKIADLHNKLTLNPNLFAELAKNFSDDGSATKGGDLGWVFPRDLVPEFERVMDSLKPNEIALPLRSQFGWHIVQVLDRKSVDMPLIRLRNQARIILREQRQQQSLIEWLEGLKAQAYIEYKNKDIAPLPSTQNNNTAIPDNTP
jgi:peptidyl-prolyl cis-trans isomerase SurA